MDAGTMPRAVYGDIEKMAIGGGDLRTVRTRIHQFKADLAAADLGFSKATEVNDQLRRMLVIASKRHRSADIRVFKEAIQALIGKAELDGWEEYLFVGARIQGVTRQQ